MALHHLALYQRQGRVASADAEHPYLDEAGAFFVLRRTKKSPILIMVACGGVNLLLNLLI